MDGTSSLQPLEKAGQNSIGETLQPLPKKIVHKWLIARDAQA